MHSWAWTVLGWSWGFTLRVMACSPNPGWRPSSFSLQSAAAQIVLEGTADGRFSCQSFGSQADDAKKEYHLKDEELFNQSGLCSFRDEVLVLVRNITILKGSASCSEALIGGFSNSAMCGTDPPYFTVRGTYFLCQVVNVGNLCHGVLNTNGDIHLGFSTSPKDVPTWDCSQDDACVDVTLCSESLGFLQQPSWMYLSIALGIGSLQALS